MGNGLKFFELLCFMLWFGGAAYAHGTSLRAQWTAVAGLACVTISRGVMWGWTPLQTTGLVLFGAAAFAAWKGWRWVSLGLALVYLAWLASRGY